MLNNVFVSYYLEMFTEIARISTGWFFVGQVVFCVWNCTNDVLFGWMSDSALQPLRSASGWGSTRGLSRRLRAIEIGGPIWVLAFVCVFWWPFDPRLAEALPQGFTACSRYAFMMACSPCEINHSALR